MILVNFFLLFWSQANLVRLLNDLAIVWCTLFFQSKLFESFLCETPWERSLSMFKKNSVQFFNFKASNSDE